MVPTKDVRIDALSSIPHTDKYFKQFPLLGSATYDPKVLLGLMLFLVLVTSFVRSSSLSIFQQMPAAGGCMHFPPFSSRHFPCNLPAISSHFSSRQ